MSVDQAWRHYSSTQAARKTVDQALLTLIAVTDSEEAVVLGNAFIVVANGNSAICMGAAHTFEHTQKLETGRKPIPHPTFVAAFPAKEPNYWKPGIKALFVGLGEPIVCDIGQFNFVANYDAVLFCVIAPKASSNIFQKHIAVNLSVPRPGERIGLLTNDLSTESDGSSTILKRATRMMEGAVTNTEMGRGRLGFHVFETTIPVAPGMSGSPFFMFRDDQTITACGIASHDISEENAFQSVSNAGNSTAAMIWPSVALGLTLSVNGEASKFISLHEMIKQKIIDCRSENVLIDVTQSGETQEITYSDERTSPATRMHCTMNAHPNS